MLSYSGQLLRIRSRAIWARPTHWTRQVRLLLIFTHRIFSLTQPDELTKSLLRNTVYRSHPDVAQRHYPNLFHRFFPQGLPAQGEAY